MNSILTQASRQWMKRPGDERYTSLLDMRDFFELQRSQSSAKVVPSRRIQVQPLEDHRGLQIVGPNGHAYNPTHWAFGQLASLAGAPAKYLRNLPAEIAADCLNYGYQISRDIEDVGVLLQLPQDGSPMLRAATGPAYGRIWNSDIISHLVERFGDGVNGDWRVPGEFGKRVTVTKENTTLYAGDRDMFVFLADEEHRIEMPNRRNGESGSLARGFFVWNSEVGSQTFGLGTFLFDYVCCNRIVWGATEYKEIKIRHTASAPDKFMDELQPALKTYANSSTKSITDAVEAAKADRLGDKLNDFLSKRFGAQSVAAIKKIHELEEGRPIETRWDVITAVTAKARGIQWQDQRVDLERQAGDLLSA